MKIVEPTTEMYFKGLAHYYFELHCLYLEQILPIIDSEFDIVVSDFVVFGDNSNCQDIMYCNAPATPDEEQALRYLFNHTNADHYLKLRSIDGDINHWSIAIEMRTGERMLLRYDRLDGAELRFKVQRVRATDLFRAEYLPAPTSSDPIQKEVLKKFRGIQKLSKQPGFNFYQKGMASQFVDYAKLEERI